MYLKESFENHHEHKTVSNPFEVSQRKGTIKQTREAGDRKPPSIDSRLPNKHAHAGCGVWNTTYIRFGTVVTIPLKNSKSGSRSRSDDFQNLTVTSSSKDTSLVEFSPRSNQQFLREVAKRQTNKQIHKQKALTKM